MKAFFLRTISVVVFLGLLCQGVWAQNKTQAYYNSHEREILPDARAAFKSGNYARTTELCRWHYIIVGDRAADSLREQAERCGELVRQMNDLKNQGKTDDAKAAAQALLAINPDDAATKQLVKEIEEAEKAAKHDPEPIPEPKPEPQSVKVDTVAVEPPVEDPVKDAYEIGMDPYLPITPTVEPIRTSQPTEAKNNQFLVKAGATAFLKPFAIAPGAGVGIYNLGGTPFSVEAGLYFGSLAEKTASLFGMDAAVAFHVSDTVYPKASLGFFSCKSKETGSSTNGLCAGAGLTFLVGGHFCVEAGLKFYPKVNVSGTTLVSTAGNTYDFPAPVEVLGGGVAPMVSVGWAF